MAVKIYFGVPGSGKTTFAARVVYKNLKKGFPTFSNVPIQGAFLYDTKDLGRYMISDCDLIIDEASIDFNNRKFKSLPLETIQFLKYYRHYGIRDIYVFSQSYDDMDITLRRLATEIYVVRRSLIPFVFVARRISVKIGIDENTHQIIDEYFFKFLGIYPYLGAWYFSMFDSWSTPYLPETTFELVRVPQTPESLQEVYRDIRAEKNPLKRILALYRRRKGTTEETHSRNIFRAFRRQDQETAEQAERKAQQ